MRIETKEILNYKEVLGLIVYESEIYQDLFDKIKVLPYNDDLELNIELEVIQYVENEKIDFISIIPYDIVCFLGLDESRTWFVNNDTDPNIIL